MQPERWKTIEEIFHAALDHPPEKRGAYLDSACGNDPELRREIESLLNEASQPASFIEPPITNFAETVLELAQPASLTGRELNHYRIGPLLGSGGMAEVYRARDTRLQRDVAMKVLHSAHVFDRERLGRLYREAQLLAAVNHPNVASVFGFEEGNGICAVVLELVEGETLAERIARQPIPIESALDIVTQVVAGLEAAHSKGIIHRDLKPSNIKITPNGTVKVLDFGIAKLLQPPDEQPRPTTISQQNVVLGTVAYMSPEQARGRTIDARTDIWAFGCLLYEMMTGAPAFEGETPTDIIIKIAAEEPDWSRFLGASGRATSELQRIAQRCLQKVAASRYSSVRELASELEGVRRPFSQSGAVPAAAAQSDFALPPKSARPLFIFTQFGYLALYTAAMHYIDSIGGILSSDFGVRENIGIVSTVVLAVCGVAVRLYLISAVGWEHRAAGEKFHRLFPALLLFDGIWAASPLLLWRHLGYGIALTCVAMLAYVPFSQRTMIRSLYPGTQARGFSGFFETR